MTTSEVVQMAAEGVEQLEVYFGKYLSQLIYSLTAPVTLFVVLSFVKSRELRKLTDMYFQKTLSLPLSAGLSTTNSIPGSNDTSLQAKAGKARSFKEYLITPSLRCNSASL